MSDLGNANWSETAASNNATPPNGWPEGMNPSDVNNAAREDMAALKRWWNRNNAVKTTGGTSSAMTLTYDVAASAYYDGEIFTFLAGATPVAGCTLNINGLGARDIWLFGGTILAGAFIAGQAVTVRYSTSDSAFSIIPQNGFNVMSTVTTTAGATFDFPFLQATVNHVRLVVEGAISTNGAQIGLRTYDTTGTIDSGGSDYFSWGTLLPSTAGAAVPTAATTSYMALTGQVLAGGNLGFNVIAEAVNIQAARYTLFDIRSAYADSAGVVAYKFLASGERVEADRITGCRVITTSGTMTGYATLYGSL